MCCINDAVLSHTGLWSRSMSSSLASRPCTAPAQWHVSLGIPRLACLGNVLAAWCVRLCSFVLCVGAMLAAHEGGTHPWPLFAALVSFVFRCMLPGGFSFVGSVSRSLRLSLRVAWRVLICWLRCSFSSLISCLSSSGRLVLTVSSVARHRRSSACWCEHRDAASPQAMHCSVPLGVHRQTPSLA